MKQKYFGHDFLKKYCHLVSPSWHETEIDFVAVDVAAIEDGVVVVDVSIVVDAVVNNFFSNRKAFFI